jgi:hypothetical protein
MPQYWAIMGVWATKEEFVLGVGNLSFEINDLVTN